MQAFISDIVQLVKKYRKGVKVFFVFIILISVYLMLPRILMKKPIVHEITPSVIMEKTQFNADNRIVLEGKNLNHVMSVFVNGIWEPDCYVKSVSETQIELILPSEYYSSDQNLTIQVETRINSEITALSNKTKVQVLSTESISVPKVASVSPNYLVYNGSLIQNMAIEGDGFNGDSVVLVDGRPCETVYDNNCLNVALPFSAWCDVDDITLQVVQYYNGYPTPIKSKEYYVATDREESFTSFSQNTTAQNEKEIQNGLEMTKEWLKNSFAMVQYLQTISKENYMVFISVKDEASTCITPDIQDNLFSLGLTESLYGAWRNSYLAILDGGTVVYESLGNELIQHSGTIEDVQFYVESSGANTGNTASIQVEGNEYALNQRGMNIVVYDKTTQTVVDSVCFDLYDKVKVIK